MSGKSQGVLRWMISGNPDILVCQDCIPEAVLMRGHDVSFCGEIGKFFSLVSPVTLSYL